MNVLVIVAHPRKESYCAALADAYCRGARDSGICVKELFLADLHFEKNVTAHSPEKQFLEDDILLAKDLIVWADHLVFVYPTWWGNVPALLKSFMDRIIMPGFAFKELQYDTYDKKLAPRTAQLITTMDTPLFVYKYIYGAPGTKAMKHATLKFCGVSPVRTLLLSPVKHSDAAQKQAWIKQVYNLGKALSFGVLTPWEKLVKKVSPWMQAIRLQFYPMTFFAYGCGAFAARQAGFAIDWLVFILGYFVLFFLEVGVVFSNDYFDRASDKINKHYSLFTGGSRVLVEGLIAENTFKAAIRNVLLVCGVLSLIVAYQSFTPFYISILMITAVFIIGISYTVPPLKFSYHGMGELVVGLTHSVAMIVCGYVFQGGNIQNAYPWLLSLPLFLSIVPAIILAGIPDYEADRQTGKGTLAVRLGVRNAGITAIFFVVAAIALAFYLKETGYLSNAYGNAIYGALAHTVVLVFYLCKYIQKNTQPKRIDGLLMLALSYLMWFTLIPFFKLM